MAKDLSGILRELRGWLLILVLGFMVYQMKDIEFSLDRIEKELGKIEREITLKGNAWRKTD